MAHSDMQAFLTSFNTFCLKPENANLPKKDLLKAFSAEEDKRIREEKAAKEIKPNPKISEAKLKVLQTIFTQLEIGHKISRINPERKNAKPEIYTVKKVNKIRGRFGGTVVTLENNKTLYDFTYKTFNQAPFIMDGWNF